MTIHTETILEEDELTGKKLSGTPRTDYRAKRRLASKAIIKKAFSRVEVVPKRGFNFIVIRDPFQCSRGFLRVVTQILLSSIQFPARSIKKPCPIIILDPFQYS